MQADVILPKVLSEVMFDYTTNWNKGLSGKINWTEKHTYMVSVSHIRVGTVLLDLWNATTKIAQADVFQCNFSYVINSPDLKKYSVWKAKVNS